MSNETDATEKAKIAAELVKQRAVVTGLDKKMQDFDDRAGEMLTKKKAEEEARAKKAESEMRAK